MTPFPVRYQLKYPTFVRQYEDQPALHEKGRH